MKIEIATTMLSALAHDSRLAIFKILVQAGPIGVSIGAIRDAMQIPGPTLTAHLNILRQAQLVRDTRDGRIIRSRADFENMNLLMSYLMENCCKSSNSAMNETECCLPKTNRKPKTNQRA
jgi:ArsR family transcriptional regulator, arsenate/arsenite/antimonite-responsive transcriptional repressor